MRDAGHRCPSCQRDDFNANNFPAEGKEHGRCRQWSDGVRWAGSLAGSEIKKKSGIPRVVDVPVVGNILSNSTNSTNRTELIVFVQPHVIRDNVDAQRVAQELRKRMPGFNNW
jgi:hypothetical protein